MMLIVTFCHFCYCNFTCHYDRSNERPHLNKREISPACAHSFYLHLDTYMWICIARLHANAFNVLRYGSHSVTCKEHHICLYSQSQSITTHCTYRRRDDQAELTWVVGETEINFLHQELNPMRSHIPVTRPVVE